MQKETYTEPQLKEILDKRISSNSESKEKEFEFRGRQYIILPKVFSPTFFPNTHWFSNALLDNMPTVASFLQIGTGAGNVLAEALLLGKCQQAMGSDISADAIHNAAINLSKLNLQAEVLVSDVLDEIHEEKKFDLIYWNYPFHYHFDKSYESMDPIQLSLRDPEYRHLEKLLATAKPHLTPSGYIIISFSLKLGNVKRLQELLNQFGWSYSIFTEREADESKKQPHLCLLKLVAIQ